MCIAGYFLNFSFKARWGKRTCPRLKTASVGFEPRTSVFRDLRSYPLGHRAPRHCKQNVRDKVGPLEDNAGNIITQGFLMAEELNMHFSSVFTREDTSSLPVPETKFKGSEGEGWGS